jgi:carbon-monoxide dehydrogenase large subunit
MRREDDALLRGQGRFIADGVPEDALAIAFLRADRAKRQITALDCTAARDMPGVALVLQGADIALARAPSVNPLATPLSLPRFDALALDVVHAVGQPIVAVVATTEGSAQDALETIQVVYGKPVTGETTVYARHWTS